MHDLLSRSSGVNNLGVYRGYRNRNCLGALRAYGDPARSFDERAITSVSYGVSQIAPVRRLTIYYFDWAILSRHREPGGSRAAVRIDYDAVFRLRHSNFHRVDRPGRFECVRKPRSGQRSLVCLAHSAGISQRQMIAVRNTTDVLRSTTPKGRFLLGKNYR